jgi:hypothetical protein
MVESPSLPIDRSTAPRPRGERPKSGYRTSIERRHYPAYRLYEVQNGNHIETYKGTFPQLELIQPHAQRAFDLLVNYVEQGVELPPTSVFRAAVRSPLRRPSRGIAPICSCREPSGDRIADMAAQSASR